MNTTKKTPAIKLTAPHWAELSFVAFRIERGNYKPVSWLNVRPASFEDAEIAAWRVIRELWNWSHNYEAPDKVYAVRMVLKEAWAILAIPRKDCTTKDWVHKEFARELFEFVLMVFGDPLYRDCVRELCDAGQANKALAKESPL